MEIVKREWIDFLLAVVGSVIDGTNFVAFAGLYTGGPTDLLAYGLMPIPADVAGNAIPATSVLTLPATGSEMNSGAVISYGHSKLPAMSGFVFPTFSLLDPSLTFTLVQTQVANGIVDAFVTRPSSTLHPAAGIVQDRFTEILLQTLVEGGGKSVAGPDNYEIRANHVCAATLARNGLIGAGVPQDWATLMIGHELTALFGIDHGKTLAVRIRLSEYGIGAERIPGAIEMLKEHGMTKLSGTGEITPDVAKKILEKAL